MYIPSVLWMQIAASWSLMTLSCLSGDITSCLTVQFSAMSDRLRSRFCIAWRHNKHDISASHALWTSSVPACNEYVSPALCRRNQISNFRSSPTSAVSPMSDVYKHTVAHKIPANFSTVTLVFLGRELHLLYYWKHEWILYSYCNLLT